MGLMRGLRKKMKHDTKLLWLPIDSRLIPPLFQFSHLGTAAKIFVMVEMVLSGSVVVGTGILVVLHLLGL
jgi:hypothetical protein